VLGQKERPRRPPFFARFFKKFPWWSRKSHSESKCGSSQPQVSPVQARHDAQRERPTPRLFKSSRGVTILSSCCRRWELMNYTSGTLSSPGACDPDQLSRRTLTAALHSPPGIRLDRSRLGPSLGDGRHGQRYERRRCTGASGRELRPVDGKRAGGQLPHPSPRLK
jgi:hypothetical protein